MPSCCKQITDLKESPIDIPGSSDDTEHFFKII